MGLSSGRQCSLSPEKQEYLRYAVSRFLDFSLDLYVFIFKSTRPHLLFCVVRSHVSLELCLICITSCLVRDPPSTAIKKHYICIVLYFEWMVHVYAQTWLIRCKWYYDCVTKVWKTKRPLQWSNHQHCQFNIWGYRFFCPLFWWSDGSWDVENWNIAGWLLPNKILQRESALQGPVWQQPHLIKSRDPRTACPKPGFGISAPIGL